jgi:putative membrane protein
VPDPDESKGNHVEKDSGELAADRTDLAEDRTVLAHERSFASWLRTGLASVAIAVGFNALFRTMEPDWMAKAIATASWR